MHKIKKLLIFLLAVIVFLDVGQGNIVDINASEVAEKNNDVDNALWPIGPDIEADAAIVMDCNTGTVLYEKDAYTAYYPASITKIFTALLAVENCSLTETVTMSRDAETKVDGSRIGLVAGEQLSLKDALYGMLLESANEVAYAIGEHVSGSNMEAFAEMMNAKVKELGGVNSNFVNSNGLHDDNHYTCAYDMGLICVAAAQYPEILKIAGTRTYTIPPTNKNVSRPLANHHRFIRKTLNYEYAIAGKTGGTDEAKTTLVTYAKKGDMTIVAVILHEANALTSYDDTIKICNFAFENYKEYNIHNSETTSNESIPLLFSENDEFGASVASLLKIDSSKKVVLPNTANFSDAVKKVNLDPPAEYEHGDNVVGNVTYEYGGKIVGKAEIYYYEADYPLTQKAFSEKWPSFLIDPGIYFPVKHAEKEEEEETNVDAGIEITKSQMSSAKQKALRGSIIIGVIILIVGFVYFYIILPIRKEKLRRERRKNLTFANKR